MKELSIFIDESGDFGRYDFGAPYYIISLVILDQSIDISQAVADLNYSLKQIGFTKNCLHVGPLIRKEKDYTYLTVNERIKILRRMMNFISHVDFTYQSFVVEKKNIKDEAELAAKLAQEVARFVKDNYHFFLSYDTVKIYYDNGQVEVTKIIISVFTTLLESAQLKKAFQKDYKLSQVADLICTATLVELKKNHKNLSPSEKRVFGSDRDIEKNLLKPLRRKKFKK